MIITDMTGLGLITRQRRLDLGWTQQQLADAAGVSRPWVSEFEHGKARVEMRLGFAVLHALRLIVTVAPSENTRTDSDPARGPIAIPLKPASAAPRSSARPSLTRDGKSIGLARATSSFDFERKR